MYVLEAKATSERGNEMLIVTDLSIPTSIHLDLCPVGKDKILDDADEDVRVRTDDGRSRHVFYQNCLS